VSETHVIEYEITEEQAAAAVDAVVGSLAARPGQMRLREIILRSVGYGIVAAAGIALSAVWDLPWWMFILPVLMLALIAFVLVTTRLTAPSRQRRQLNAALREAFRRLESPHVRWTVTDEELVVESGRDAREFGWDEVKEVFLTGTFWLLTVENGPMMLLLADRIPDATARFLLTRARRAGATIRVAGLPNGPGEEGVTIIG
jgi:uncharacterized membrane protein YfcA